MKKNTSNCKRGLFLLMLLLFGISALEAQGWNWVIFQQGGGGGPFAADGNYATSVTEVDAGAAFFLVNNPESNADYYFSPVVDGRFWGAVPNKFSSSGGLHHFSRAAVLLAPDTVAVLEEVLPVAGGGRKIYLSLYAIKIPQGPGITEVTLLWHKEVFGLQDVDAFARSLHRDDAGNYFILGEKIVNLSGNARDVIAVKLSKDGEVIWTHDLGGPADEQAIALVPTASPAGGHYIFKNNISTSNPGQQQIVRTTLDANGLSIAEINLTAPSASESAVAAIGLADGGSLVATLDLLAGREVFFRKTDAAGTTIWQQNYPMTNRSALPTAIVETPEGDLVATGEITDSVAMETDGLLLKMDANGTPLWERTIGKTNRWEALRCITLYPDGGYLLGGTAKVQNVFMANMVRTDINGIVKAGLIEGNVFHDLDLECANTTGDTPLKNWVVQAYLDSLTVFYANTDSLGNYRIECDTGNYVISLVTPNSYWDVCANDLPLHIGYLDTVQLDFAAQTAIECPYLWVDHGTTNIRPCDTTYFNIEYCNFGTIDADDAYLEMTLDTVFTFLNSDIPPASINGNVISFPLGTIASGSCGSFSFSVLVSCAATPGQVACSEAHIFPDSICTAPGPDWSGAFIAAQGICDGDTVRFQLLNTGTQAMLQTLDYIVIEDAVLLQQGSFDLNMGENMQIPLNATGATYHLIAEQEPGAPGNSIPIAAVEGCVGNSGNPPSINYFNQFPQNDGDPFLSVFCPLVINSFDPNDKQAVPTGFDDEHFIFKNTDLEYTIRFQNTGTDTAFRVVLIDTLSAYLDPTSVRPGASSHPYDFQIDASGLLRFTFRDIKLPHQSVNDQGSQGFVNFRIAQKRNNPVGTVIENSAGIYFDFNVPVITNTTWHTVHEPLIQVVNTIDKNTSELGRILSYPNPAVDVVHFKMPEQAPATALFSLYNSVGKRVKTGSFVEGLYRFERGALPPGIYFYQVENMGQRLYSGKVMLR